MTYIGPEPLEPRFVSLAFALVTCSCGERAFVGSDGRSPVGCSPSPSAPGCGAASSSGSAGATCPCSTGG
jgi:hypothetical protein